MLLLAPLLLAPLAAGASLRELETNEDFIIGSSCAIEAIDSTTLELDEGRLEKCGNCFDKETTLEGAYGCVVTHLPNLYSACRDVVDAEDSTEEDVARCFMAAVRRWDTDGEVRRGVRDFLGL